ncbi:preprotein translocase subunit SecY [Candidatus Dojkabacteria bacterium]|nr:preprotein translocase subunit SecY [Candidatus Dojkabacteria bacterium]
MLETQKKSSGMPASIFSRTVRKVSGETKKSGIFTKFQRTFANKDIRNRFLFTMLMVLVFRLLSAVPLPGIDPAVFKEFFQGTPFSNIFTIVTGGRLDNPSIVAIGLASYINASIMIQLFTTVIPSLEEMSKEGERGKQKLNQITRVLTVPLTVLQSVVIYTILKNSAGISNLVAESSVLDVVTMITTLTAGTMLLMWISEIISESGIGNGSSIIISAGVLAVIPSFISQDFQSVELNFKFLLEGKLEVLWSSNMLLIYAIIVGLVVLLLGIVFMSEATRKLSIQYARRVRGGVAGFQNTFLPIKLNQAGVMPVIFASSILILPQILSQFVVSSFESGKFYDIANAIGNSFLSDYGSFGYNLTYFFAIIGFTFFYTFVVLNPNDTADNLKKSGGFIPGIRPGTSTASYITKVMIRLTIVGGIFLGAIALAPSLINQFATNQFLGEAANYGRSTLFSGIGGTSLLILVGVILDTKRKIESMAVTRSYEHYKD